MLTLSDSRSCKMSIVLSVPFTNRVRFMHLSIHPVPPPRGGGGGGGVYGDIFEHWVDLARERERQLTTACASNNH